MFNEKKELESPYYSLYEIKKGDSLYKISKEFNVNTFFKPETTGLNIDDYLCPEEISFVLKKDVSYYITKDGDTLYTVSNVFDTKESNIVSQNKTIYLLPGQMIFFKK